MNAPQPEEEHNKTPDVGQLSPSEARELAMRLRERHGSAIFQIDEKENGDPTEVALSAIQVALGVPDPWPDQYQEFRVGRDLLVNQIQEDDARLSDMIQPLQDDDTPDDPSSRKTRRVSLLQRLANVGLGRHDQTEPLSGHVSDSTSQSTSALPEQQQVLYRKLSPKLEDAEEHELLSMRHLVLHAINERLGKPEDHLAAIRSELRSVTNVGA